MTGAALEYYRRAIDADPSFSVAYMHLASALETSGSGDATIEVYRQMLVMDPQSAVGHYNLGLLYLRMEKHAEARACFRTALDLDTPFPEAWVGLSASLEALKREEEALGALNNALSEREDYAGALFNAAMLLRKLGRHEEAMARDARGLELEPEHAIIHYRLGCDLSNAGHPKDAEARYQRALELEPEFLDAHLALASSLKAQGRESESLCVLFEVVARHPESEWARQCLVRQLDGVTLASAGEIERAVLLQLCRDNQASMRSMTPAIIGLLKNAPGFHLLQRCVESNEDPFAERDPAIEELLSDSLLLVALPRIQMTDPSLERVITHVRRHLLLRFSNRGIGDSTIPLDLAGAIAGQCFFAGYPLFIADDERRCLAIVRDEVACRLARLAFEPWADEAALSTIAMYEYLGELPGSEQLLDSRLGPWSAALDRILRQQLENRRIECEIATQLDAISPIEDATSLAVRRQYDEHPYPVWLDLPPVTANTVEGLCSTLRGGRSTPIPARPFRILVAGCGTGAHSILVAKTYPDCEVLAVDLSRVSLSYAARMTKQFGISNIEYRQGDILELARLQERFAIVECCGVLHHLSDPLAGWRVLVRLLDPAGVMRIGLYSERARRQMGIDAARELVRLHNISDTSDGVRRCRRTMMELPDDHPAKPVLGCGDFYSLNGCRDLIMHVQEHVFTPVRLADCLDQLGLRFLGMQCTGETQRRFREMFSESASAVDLLAWDRFEEAYPSTFNGMYLFWCDKR